MKLVKFYSCETFLNHVQLRFGNPCRQGVLYSYFWYIAQTGQDRTPRVSDPESSHTEDIDVVRGMWCSTHGKPLLVSLTLLLGTPVTSVDYAFTFSMLYS
jgi:hypothetical protein